MSRFRVYLAAPPGLITGQAPIDWQALEQVHWIYPTSHSCCGKLAQELLETHGIRPERVINVDDETVTRRLIATGVGVGLVHVNAPYDLKSHRDISLVCQVHESARVLFGHLQGRTDDPIISTVRSMKIEGWGWAHSRPKECFDSPLSTRCTGWV